MYLIISDKSFHKSYSGKLASLILYLGFLKYESKIFYILLFFLMISLKEKKFYFTFLMEAKKIRKYNSIFRKNLKTKISKLINKYDFIEIYKIIIFELENKLSINRNGIYFNLNLISDICIEKIIKLLEINENNNIQSCTEQNKIKYEIYNKENNIENFINGQKLTNQEKSLIKKFRQIN